MNKKLLVAAATLAVCSAASAQQAFQSLSFGLEVGTTGAGVELAMPIVTDHIIIKAGFNAPAISYAFSSAVDPSEINYQIDEVNYQLASLGIDERINTRFSDITLSARPVLNLSMAKVMFELYPFKKSSFHITAGAYFGMGTDGFISSTFTTDEVFWSDFTALQEEVAQLNGKYQDVPGYEAYDIDALRFSAGNRTFEMTGKDGKGYLDASLMVAKVRPYVGLGFGRSVPKKHFGFQLDLGLWYHGTPSLTSTTEVAYDASAESLIDDLSLLDQVAFYPQISLRLTYKIF